MRDAKKLAYKHRNFADLEKAPGKKKVTFGQPIPEMSRTMAKNMVGFWYNEFGVLDLDSFIIYNEESDVLIGYRSHERLKFKRFGIRRVEIEEQFVCRRFDIKWI